MALVTLSITGFEKNTDSLISHKTAHVWFYVEKKKEQESKKLNEIKTHNCIKDIIWMSLWKKVISL